MSISLLIVVIFSSPFTWYKKQNFLKEGLKWHHLIFLFIMASLVLVAGNSVYHLADTGSLHA